MGVPPKDIFHGNGTVESNSGTITNAVVITVVPSDAILASIL